MFCSNRFRRSCSRAIRSAAVLFALAGYLLAATGMPVPVLPGAASTAKDRSQPFPCMDNPCGCKDALQCWRSCCCTTPAERLAWARKHGVAPPVDLASKDLAASKPPAHSCCAAKHRPAARPCCTAGRDRASCSAADHGCASRQRKCSAQECHEPQTASADASRSSAKSQAQTPAKENIDFVVISAWRQCHGLAPLWSFLGAALSPPTPVGYEFDWQISCWFSLCSESSASADLSPAIPPPRV
jgi:hypothetical protein